MTQNPFAEPSHQYQRSGARKRFIIIIFMRSNSKKENNKGPQCTVCLERPVNCTIDGCSHEFCLRCIKKWARTKNNCPLCRERFLRIQTRNRTIEVEPIPERVRPQRAPISPPQTPTRRVVYLPLFVYPQPNCFFYQPQPGFMVAPGISSMSSPSYPLGIPSFFVPQP